MQRVEQVMIAGRPLDESATYTLATNDYMASGGDGYEAFIGSRNLIDPSAANFMASQVIDYIEKQGTVAARVEGRIVMRSEEHTSELQSLMRISYAVFCLKKKKQKVEERHEITRTLQI